MPRRVSPESILLGTIAVDKRGALTSIGKIVKSRGGNPDNAEHVAEVVKRLKAAEALRRNSHLKEAPKERKRRLRKIKVKQRFRRSEWDTGQYVPFVAPKRPKPKLKQEQKPFSKRLDGML